MPNDAPVVADQIAAVCDALASALSDMDEAGEALIAALISDALAVAHRRLAQL